MNSLSLFLSWDMHLPCLHTLVIRVSSWAFRLQDIHLQTLVLRPSELDFGLTAFLFLQLTTNSASWDFSASIATWANSRNKPPLTHLYILYSFCFSGELWLTQSPKAVCWQNFLLLRGNQFFVFLRPSADRNRPIHVMGGHLTYSKSANLNVNLF